MKKCNIKEKQSYKARACSLDGICGREIILSLHEITLYGLAVLSGYKYKLPSNKCN